MKPLFYYRFIGKYIKPTLGSTWDTLAPSVEDAINYAHKNINPEPSERDDSGEFTKEYLLASSGETINMRFRLHQELDIDNQISEMVSKHKTKIPHVLYRGVCSKVFSEMIENAKSLKGIDLYEKSFLQTSLVKGHELKADYYLRIYVPKGTEAVYLGNVNHEQDLYEVTVQKGVKMKILSIDEKYINCKIIN